MFDRHTLVISGISSASRIVRAASGRALDPSIGATRVPMDRSSADRSANGASAPLQAVMFRALV